VDEKGHLAKLAPQNRRFCRSFSTIPTLVEVASERAFMRRLQTHFGGMSISVLVVEDHVELQSSLHELITAHGYRVRCAVNLEEVRAALRDLPLPCIVLWDPVTLEMDADLIAHTARLGVHVATIPISVTSNGSIETGRATIVKRLASRDAVLGVVRAHCAESRVRAAM
jgi:CheY-like chemotaxis protein